MTWLRRLFHRAELDATTAEGLRRWRECPADDLDTAAGDARYVVLDVESTGLDLRRDRLIAIGAVAVRAGCIDLADSFEVILRQERVSAKDNILVHGIGGERQREGLPPPEALLAFLDYLGKSPLVAFHVAFDETMIRRACREHLSFDFRHPWLDLAYLMPALLPDLARTHRALDHWAAHFAIANYARHSALADALATAQLFLAALSLANARQSGSFRQWQALARAQVWLGRMN